MGSDRLENQAVIIEVRLRQIVRVAHHAEGVHGHAAGGRLAYGRFDRPSGDGDNGCDRDAEQDTHGCLLLGFRLEPSALELTPTLIAFVGPRSVASHKKAHLHGIVVLALRLRMSDLGPTEIFERSRRWALPPRR